MISPLTTHIIRYMTKKCFVNRGRTLATGAVAGFGNFLQFLGTKLFLTYIDYLTLGGTFFMYAGKRFNMLMFL